MNYVDAYVRQNRNRSKSIIVPKCCFCGWQHNHGYAGEAIGDCVPFTSHCTGALSGQPYMVTITEKSD